MKIAPSMLSADFANLAESIALVEQAGVEYLHIDIMDGDFVPNISFGPMVYQAIRNQSNLVFDVHMMVRNPERYIELAAKAGADVITVHVEATEHIHRALQLIKQQGVKAGVVINPGTPVALIEPLLAEVDQVLVMTVNPGFGGQKFIPATLTKIKQLDALRKANGYHYEIEVDGGINAETGKLCVEAGTDILVAGSYIFDHENPLAAIESLRQIG